MAATLPDRIRKNFSRINLNHISVKVPKLKPPRKKRLRLKKENKTPVSSIISILIRKSLEEAKKEKRNEKKAEAISYKLSKEEKQETAGGYGTISKNYGASPVSAYVDYEKLFSYLGKFRATSAYESAGNSETIGNSVESRTFSLIDKETMDKGARYVKYLMPRGTNLDTTSLVPLAGMNSAEWEQFRLWMKLDPVMYALKTQTA